MKMKMVDNAVDSLQIVLRSVHRWIHSQERDGDRYLKISITFLHNAIELLIKAMLVKKDEFSIYKENQLEGIKQAKEIANEEGISLDEYLINNLDIKTLEYSKLLDKYEEQFVCDEKTKDVLIKLGHYRNSITHFGIDCSQNLIDLYNVIYESFNIILNVFYDDLIEIHDYFSYNDVIDMFESWCEAGEEFQREIAAEEPKRNVQEFVKVFQKTIYSCKMKNFMDSYNVSLEDESVYETNNVFLTLLIKQRREITIISKYDAYYNYTSVEDDDGYVWFIILHYENKIYVPTDLMLSIDKEYEYEDIKFNYTKKRRKEKNLTENNIRNIFIENLKNVINNVR